MAGTLLKLICRINGQIHRAKFQYSQEYEGNAEYMNLGEKLWWGYKYFFHPVEKAEKGKHLEAYFRKQKFDFGVPEGFEETGQVTVTAGGDILASHHIRTDNTSGLWNEAEDFLFQSDLCCANLETPVVPSQAASFVPKNILKAPALNNTPEVFDLFYRGGKGINFFSTANNHCLDMGEAGLLETLAFLDQRGCPHVGTAESEQQRDDFPVFERNGIRIAILSYTFSTNGKPVPEGKEYLANYVRLNNPDSDISLIRRQIYQAKTEKKADVVIACLHWSLEFEAYPVRNVMDMGHRLMEQGIDIIIGNHPHGIQPMEKYSFTDPFSGTGKQGLILYALGDLISCHEHIPNSRLNMLVSLNISKGMADQKEMTVISGMKIRPMYIYSKMKEGQCIDFRLLHFTKLTAKLHENINRMHFDAAEIQEIERLEKLMQKLLPSEIIE